MCAAELQADTQPCLIDFRWKDWAGYLERGLQCLSWVKVVEQGSSTFLMLQLFNTGPHVVLIPQP